VRNWALWILGFALSFGLFLSLLLFYSLAQPSLWLPVAFGVIFGILLNFQPRLNASIRVGSALAFTSASCLLWMASGEDSFNSKYAAVPLVLKTILATAGIAGLVAIGIGSARSKKRPSLTPIIVLMLEGWIISYLSSSHGGASPMVDWVMHAFGFDHSTAENVVVAFRKTVHFTFYATVAATAFVAALRNDAARRACFALALATTGAYASFDELRQSTQPDRVGSAWDVLLDLTGASAALVVVGLVSAKSKTRRKTQRP
jgi:VanZ family protein